MYRFVQIVAWQHVAAVRRGIRGHPHVKQQGSSIQPWILTPDGDTDGGAAPMWLLHLQYRHGDCRGIELRFDRKRQSFAPRDVRPSARERSRAIANLQAAWRKTVAAMEGGDDE